MHKLYPKACEGIFPEKRTIEISITDLTRLSNIVTLFLYNRPMYIHIVSSNLRLGNYEHETSAEELKLKKRLIEIYEIDSREAGDYIDDAIESEFEQLACEYQSRRFSIREYEPEKVWAEVGKILTRRYFQQKANYRYSGGKFMLHEMRWYLKKKVSTFRDHLIKSLLEYEIGRGSNNFLEIAPNNIYNSQNFIRLKIGRDLNLEDIIASIPKVTSKNLIVACKEAIKNPPYESIEQWSMLDEYLNFSYDSVRGLVNSISIGKKITIKATQGL